jgi:hypothetical protein
LKALLLESISDAVVLTVVLSCFDVLVAVQLLPPACEDMTHPKMVNDAEVRQHGPQHQGNDEVIVDHISLLFSTLRRRSRGWHLHSHLLLSIHIFDRWIDSVTHMPGIVPQPDHRLG